MLGLAFCVALNNTKIYEVEICRTNRKRKLDDSMELYKSHDRDCECEEIAHRNSKCEMQCQAWDDRASFINKLVILTDEEFTEVIRRVHAILNPQFHLQSETDDYQAP